jgi:hypothetical protein
LEYIFTPVHDILPLSAGDGRVRRFIEILIEGMINSIWGWRLSASDVLELSKTLQEISTEVYVPAKTAPKLTRIGLHSNDEQWQHVKGTLYWYGSRFRTSLLMLHSPKCLSDSPNAVGRVGEWECGDVASGRRLEFALVLEWKHF